MLVVSVPQRATQQVIVPDRLKLRFLKVVLPVKVVYNQNGFAGPAAGKFSRWAARR
jgi:hypothetical protein